MRMLRAVGAGARWALAMEWRMYVGVWRLLARRHDVPPGATAVPYVGGVAVRERSTGSSRSPTVTEEQGRPVLHVAIASRTNVDVRLSRPLPVLVHRATHQVREVRLFADDPRALAAAVWARAGRGAGRPPDGATGLPAVTSAV